MPKRKTKAMEGFGPRLAMLREAAGYTQVELAAGMGITQRMVTYYEASSAQAPGVSVGVLLGLAEQRQPEKLVTNCLERRLMDSEKLAPKAKRQIAQLLDSCVHGVKLKQRAGQRSAAGAREAARP